jgi:hypothetical protein
MDPQFLYDSAYEDDLRKQLDLIPSKVDVLEVDALENGQITNNSKSLNELELCAWLDSITSAQEDVPDKQARGGLRLILGPSSPSISTKELPSTFPNGRQDIRSLQPIPFSGETFSKIIAGLHLPFITPWLLTTDQSHFERHTTYSKTHIGYTMRRPTWGVLAMNISLSLSYSHSTCMTFGLLLGCSEFQQFFIIHQLKSLARLACHPLLIPVLLSTHQRQLLHQEARRIWLSLIEIENASGQTGLPVEGGLVSSIGNQDYSQITKMTLGVIQAASAWQSTLKDIILGIDSIKESLTLLSGTMEDRLGEGETPSVILLEWLRFTLHQSKVLLGQLEYIDKRGQAQMTAVRESQAYQQDVSTD